MANLMARFVLDTDLDGIDVAWGDVPAARQEGGAAERWLTTFTQTLRQSLPKGQFILTHARTCNSTCGERGVYGADATLLLQPSLPASSETPNLDSVLVAATSRLTRMLGI